MSFWKKDAVATAASAADAAATTDEDDGIIAMLMVDIPGGSTFWTLSVSAFIMRRCLR